MSKTSRAKHNLGLERLRSRRNFAESRGYPWYEYLKAELDAARNLARPIRRMFDYGGFIKNILKVEEIEGDV